jgi:hypothetical protein
MELTARVMEHHTIERIRTGLQLVMEHCGHTARSSRFRRHPGLVWPTQGVASALLLPSPHGEYTAQSSSRSRQHLGLVGPNSPRRRPLGTFSTEISAISPPEVGSSRHLLGGPESGSSRHLLGGPESGSSRHLLGRPESGSSRHLLQRQPSKLVTPRHQLQRQPSKLVTPRHQLQRQPSKLVIPSASSPRHPLQREHTASTTQPLQVQKDHSSNRFVWEPSVFTMKTPRLVPEAIPCAPKRVLPGYSERLLLGVPEMRPGPSMRLLLGAEMMPGHSAVRPSSSTSSSGPAVRPSSSTSSSGPAVRPSSSRQPEVLRLEESSPSSRRPPDDPTPPTSGPAVRPSSSRQPEVLRLEESSPSSRRPPDDPTPPTSARHTGRSRAPGIPYAHHTGRSRAPGTPDDPTAPTSARHTYPSRAPGPPPGRHGGTGWGEMAATFEQLTARQDKTPDIHIRIAAYKNVVQWLEEHHAVLIGFPETALEPCHVSAATTHLRMSITMLRAREAGTGRQTSPQTSSG